MAKAKIIGWGMYAPGEPIDNNELIKLTGVEFDLDRLENYLGYKQRHIAKLRGIDETTADFVTKATQKAIEKAGIDPMDIDLFIVGTDTPEFISPATSVLVQGRIQGGQRHTGSFDINTSCASGITALDVASRLLASDATLRYALVAGVYNMPNFVRPGDAFGTMLFADGAGAFILERTEDNDPSGHISGQLFSDGTQWDYIGIYMGGARRQPTHQLLDEGLYGLENLKPLPGDRNIKLWPPLVNVLLQKANMDIDDLDHIFFTQINRHVIEDVMKILDMPIDKTTTIMDRYGYTGSACIPMAFSIAAEEGKIGKGDTIMFVASGSGLTVAASLLVF